jgi:molybdate transport system regulatory protein
VTRGTRIALGPGKADLLEAIARDGSISSAARSMRMSYRRAWLLVETMNRCFTRPLVATSRWRGEGARLTPDGRRALTLYRRIETASLAVADRMVADLKKLLRPRADSPRRP